MAHVGGRYADIKFAHDPMETAVEVHSAWGTFEWIVRDAFEKNYRVGIVGNSDGHKGRPGACYPGASFFGSYGGLTCFLAERLDRDAIFECMRRRRHYATTGNRALLDVTVDDGVAGRGVPARSGGGADEVGEGAAAADGRHRPRRRRRGGTGHRGDRLGADRAARHLRRPRPDRDGAALRGGRSRAPRARSSTRARSIAAGRAPRRGTVRSASRATASCARPSSTTGTSIAASSTRTQTGLTWKAVTTGNYGAIDLWLEQAAARAA